MLLGRFPDAAGLWSGRRIGIAVGLLWRAIVVNFGKIRYACSDSQVTNDICIDIALYASVAYSHNFVPY